MGRQFQVRRRWRSAFAGGGGIGVPTVREPDGLALSSRNRYLTTAERARAPTLHQALTRAATTLARGAAAASVLTTGRAALERDGFAVDYLALVDGMSLRAIDAVRPGARLIVAARLGAVRLIDNIASG